MATLKITQTVSRIGCSAQQKKNLDALGLRKIGKTVGASGFCNHSRNGRESEAPRQSGGRKIVSNPKQSLRQ